MSMLATETVNGYTIGAANGEKARGKSQISPPSSRDVSPVRRSVDLPRAASYTYLGNARDRKYTNSSVVNESFSEAGFRLYDDSADITPPESSGVNTPEEYLPDSEGHVGQGREMEFELPKEPQARTKPLSNSAGDGQSSTASSFKPRTSSLESSQTISTAPTTPKARSSVTSNFSRKLNRKSWIGSASAAPSRSSSPSKEVSNEKTAKAEPDAAPTTSDNASTKRTASFMKRRNSSKPQKEKASENESPSAPPDQAEDSPKRKSTLLRRKTSRPASGLFKSSPNVEEAAPTANKPARPSLQSRNTSKSEHEASAIVKAKRKSLVAIPKSFSTDRLPLSRSDPLSPHHAVPVPRLLSSDRIPKSSLAVPKKKDELWSVFRALESDFNKFISKSVSLKANVVRSCLLPFLRTYALHLSNKMLRAEDLDRRTNILNKWWTGLIELLHGRNNQSISGTDRPAILDGIAAIMERPEWRMPPSPFSPLNQRMKGTASPGNRSTTSLTSEASEFLTESVNHNVRNIFVQNLSAQMAFVIDKMSQRNASASLVAFCGKACAYAFVFVPGMADILVRLWDLHIDPIRRVLEGNGVRKFDNLSSTAEGIVSNFPPALQQLGFHSLMKYMRKLRTPPPLPIGTANFQWWGHWVNRWSGRESDLFYVFVKYFHILATDFLPPDTSRTERMCAPGFLLVHAQVLTNLDATIHRDATPTAQDPATAGASPTFDDVLGDPDAVASALPTLPSNATRSMAENRLIMLIRDFLSERAGEHPVARKLFAESFSNLLQTGARGTSMFDHSACYTLLDFLEEALVLLTRFENMLETGGSLVDLDFWTTVWRRMIHSENTMTEIRLYAFLYTIWNSVICGLGWKVRLCNGFLLDPEIFESRFNHWCPMVRAYFMRLICWRVGRYDGEASDADLGILDTAMERLQTTWSYYLFLREESQIRDALAPPTNPCNPAPSRRLLIIRTDPHLDPPRAFLSFDGIVSPRSPTDASPKALKQNASISHVIEIDTRPGTSLSMGSSFSMGSDLVDSEPRGRTGGISGFFRSFMRSKSRGKSESPAPAKAGQEAPPVPQPGSLLRSATDDVHTKQDTFTGDKPVQVIQHRNYSFKFSLEYQPNARPLPPMRLLPPRLPMAAQQYLQSSSQKAKSPNFAHAIEPRGASRARARYCGRALAEWAVVLGECQSFFERRKNEGVPSNKFVETPTLGVEVFRRPA